MPLSGVFECADQPLVLVGAFKANPLRDICAALELPDLSLDARFANLEQQFAHKAELQGMFRERFRTRHARPLARAARRRRTCCARRCATCARCWSIRRRCTTRWSWKARPPAARRYRFIASPIEMSAAHVTLKRVPPRLGEHTDEILAEAAAGAAKGRS